MRLTCARRGALRSLLTRWPRSTTPNRRRSAASATRTCRYTHAHAHAHAPLCPARRRISPAPGSEVQRQLMMCCARPRAATYNVQNRRVTVTRTAHPLRAARLHPARRGPRGAAARAGSALGRSRITIRIPRGVVGRWSSLEKSSAPLSALSRVSWTWSCGCGCARLCTMTPLAPRSGTSSARVSR